jgi:spore maturation protein CgeB
MRIVIFCHSLCSDWNHGNAHFLRGVARELLIRGHEVAVYEPRDAWSVENLVRDHGEPALDAYRIAYPELTSTRYDLAALDLDRALDGADLVLVHEWNDHDLVRRIGLHRAAHHAYRLLFHDTHHRAVSDPDAMARYDLTHYDGVLAFGSVIRDLYVARRWARRVWTWHEAADVEVFRPVPDPRADGDLVWIGNWGDEERTAALHEFLIEPVRRLALKATVYGVRYPESALRALADAGIRYGGWLSNIEVPHVFARHRVTVHVPRRQYVEQLPGIPTIRPFEAMACGIPLVSAPWNDREELFRSGIDYLVARDGAEMERHLREVLTNRVLASRLATNGLETIRTRHTCAHRVDQLLEIAASIAPSARTTRSAEAEHTSGAHA